MKRRRESHGSGRSKASLLDLHARLDDLEIQRDKIQAVVAAQDTLGDKKIPAIHFKYTKMLKECDHHIAEINRAISETLTRKAALTASTRVGRLKAAADKRRRRAQRNLKLQGEIQ